MINKIIVTRTQRSLWLGDAEASAVSPRLILEKVWRRLTNYYRRWFCQQNYIFRHKGPFQEEDRNDSEFACYESFKDIPEQVKTDISSDGAPSRLGTDKLELSENAYFGPLWWTAGLHHPYLPVKESISKDGFWNCSLKMLLFRLRTHPEFRGRGLAPALIRYAIWLLLMDKPGCAYIDCRTYFKPSIRCIEKAGLERVATKKIIKRKWALYD